MTDEILLTINLAGKCFVDPKRIKLLKAISQTGSINKAAQLAKVSYKSAWDHLEMMNTISPKPLLDRNSGGKKGGGTTLTPYAQRLLQLYDLLEQTQQHAFHKLQQEDIPLDNPLMATATFAPQSSARNQFFGQVCQLHKKADGCYIGVNINSLKDPIFVRITAKSVQNLQLTLDKEVMLMVKAPWIEVSKTKPEQDDNVFYGEITKIEQQEITIKIGQDIICHSTHPHQQSFQKGDKIYLHIDPCQIILLTL